MARRTTQELVRSITSIPDSVQLWGFIDTASVMVDRIEAVGSTSNCELDDQRLELIERWLSAHLANVIVNPQITEKQIDITKEKFNVPPPGVTLRDTIYGRQALALDCTWTLEKEYGTLVESVWVGDSEDHNYYG